MKLSELDPFKNSFYKVTQLGTYKGQAIVKRVMRVQYYVHPPTDEYYAICTHYHSHPLAEGLDNEDYKNKDVSKDTLAELEAEIDATHHKDILAKVKADRTESMHFKSINDLNYFEQRLEEPLSKSGHFDGLLNTYFHKEL